MSANYWRDCFIGLLTLIVLLWLASHFHPRLKPGELPSDPSPDYFTD